MTVELSPLERRHLRDALDLLVTSQYPQSWHDLRRRFLLISAAYQPGSEVPESGQYTQVDQGFNPVGETATFVRGKPFGPTNQHGYSWMLEAPTDGEPGE